MFDEIAPRYQRVNSVCSGGRDAYWRRRTVQLVGVHAEDDVLDLACGTGDLTRVFAEAGPRFIVGCDFSHEMLRRAKGDFLRDLPNADPTAHWVEGDAQRLPFLDGAFSIVSCAFGVRNFSDLNAGLREIHRVLRIAGRAVILEFTRPSNSWIRRVYEWYSSRVMPPVATWISGDRTGAYRYLPKSVVSFLDPQGMVERLRDLGFHNVTATPLTFGIVTVYRAERGA